MVAGRKPGSHDVLRKLRAQLEMEELRGAFCVGKQMPHCAGGDQEAMTAHGLRKARHWQWTCCLVFAILVTPRHWQTKPFPFERTRVCGRLGGVDHRFGKRPPRWANGEAHVRANGVKHIFEDLVRPLASGTIDPLRDTALIVLQARRKNLCRAFPKSNRSIVFGSPDAQPSRLI